MICLPPGPTSPSSRNRTAAVLASAEKRDADCALGGSVIFAPQFLLQTWLRGDCAPSPVWCWGWYKAAGPRVPFSPTILHQDDDCVVADKPPGIIVHRGWAN